MPWQVFNMECHQLQHTVIVEFFPEEVYEFQDGSMRLVGEYKEVMGKKILDRGHYWVASREITLPFKPYTGLQIHGIYPYDDEENIAHFTIEKVSFNCHTRKWLAVLEDGVFAIKNESTAEALAEEFPGWKFRLYDDDSCLENGRFGGPKEVSP